MSKYLIIVGSLFLGVSCGSSTHATQFNDVELKAFILTYYPNALNSKKTNVFLLHNTDCNCVDEELEFASQFIQDNRSESTIVILNSTNVDLYRENESNSNVRFIIAKPNELFENGIIIATNKLLIYKNSLLTELFEIKNEIG